MNKKIKKNIYNIFVARNEKIKTLFQKYNEKSGRNKLIKILYLLLLNIQVYVFRIDITRKKESLKNHLIYDKSESSRSYINKENFINKVKQYDIISFDIFDTLIFRPFSSPTDLFFFVGEQNRILDFVKLRKNAEKIARTKTTEEITYDEIYSTYVENCGEIDELYVDMEKKKELEFCYANPFFKEIFLILKKMNKDIIITSDIYLSQEIIEQILKKNGYLGYKDIFISSEYKKSKYDGALYKIIKKKYPNQTIIHIGDNQHADIKNAQRNGFDSLYYPNINIKGNKYRTFEMSTIIGSCYRGLINSKIHCGNENLSMPYEFGYAYGGIFVLGYCRYIHKLVKKMNINKVLFLSRDGDLLSKIYSRLYPSSNIEYTYFSRLAATKLAARRYKKDYFDRFVIHKSNQNILVDDILRDMEIEGIDIKVDTNDILTDKNINELISELNRNWEQILAIYENQLLAAKLYFENVFKQYKRVAIVDVGWAGSGANTIDYLVNDLWSMNVEIISIVAGTNTFNNYNINQSESLLFSKKMFSYIYSQEKNRDIWKIHNPSAGHNMYFEMILSSTQPPFKGFYMEEGGFTLKFLDKEDNSSVVLDIQAGIIDFVDDFNLHFGKYKNILDISGSDAYAPFKYACKNNCRYLKNVFTKCVFTAQVTSKVGKKLLNEQI